MPTHPLFLSTLPAGANRFNLHFLMRSPATSTEPLKDPRAEIGGPPKQ